jgi:hypothetical protein
MWEKLRHRNVVPFHGVCRPADGIPTMISKWMEHGNARRFVAQCELNSEQDYRVQKPDCIKIVRSSIPVKVRH